MRKFAKAPYNPEHAPPPMFNVVCDEPHYCSWPWCFCDEHMVELLREINRTYAQFEMGGT
jgi:hypothetical protein